MNIYFFYLLDNTCRVKNITCSDHGQCINDNTRTEGYICYCEAGHVGDDCEIGRPLKYTQKIKNNTKIEVLLKCIHKSQHYTIHYTTTSQ